MQTNPYLTPGERTRLAAATVGIAGAGGLGSNCALHLVRSGVGRLVIADFDVVNDSNLNRQFYFRDQIGRKKVEALRENLLRIDPEADIVALDTKIDVANAKDVFAQCGIVVEAFDRADAKSLLLGALAGSGKQLVAASGIAGWGRSNAIRLRRKKIQQPFLPGNGQIRIQRAVARGNRRERNGAGDDGAHARPRG